ncbi:MAG: 2-oxoglutarate and iron-dependent oxygenase domain-containing protein [Helicobacteraceae bacterium]|nr:2-oxoglutarate and iron-dependent oxygenase domain-containing protein [Helicobacteraceae bacterium]
MNSVPVIDLSKLNGDKATQEQFFKELRYAAHKIGFFYLVGHGVDLEVCKRLFELSREFFALPLEEKLKISIDNSPHFRGYTQVGGEYTLGSQDFREEIDLGFEGYARDLSEPAYMRLHGPNQWLQSQGELREVFYKWQEQTTQMGLTLLKGFSLALYGRDDVFNVLFEKDIYQHVKLIHYPGIAEAGQEYSKEIQGVGAHKDDGFLTLLMIDKVGGLEVELESKEWIPVPYKEGAFVINIGEFLELATNGYLKATMHRVKSPLKGQDRISIPMFLGAELNKEIPIFPLPESLAKEMRGIEKDPTNPLLPIVGWNYLKHRLRSHKEVAKRFYSDIYDPTNPANPIRLES